MRSNSQAESRNVECQHEHSIRSVLFVVTLRPGFNEKLNGQHVRLAAHIAASPLDLAHFKYLSSGGCSNSLICGWSMLPRVTSETPVSMRFSTFSPRKCFTAVTTPR